MLATGGFAYTHTWARQLEAVPMLQLWGQGKVAVVEVQLLAVCCWYSLGPSKGVGVTPSCLAPVQLFPAWLQHSCSHGQSAPQLECLQSSLTP